MIKRSQLLSATELRDLSRASPWSTILPLLACYATIVVTILLAEQAASLIVYLIAALVIVSRTHAIGVLMHEFAHDHVFRSRRLNLIGGELAGLLLPFSMSRHRATHLLHHRFTSTERDPDWLQFARTPFAWLVSPDRSRLTLAAHHLFAVSGLGGLGVFLTDNWFALQNALGRPPFMAMTMRVALDANGRLDPSAVRLLHVPRWADALTLTVVAGAAILVVEYRLYWQFLYYYYIPNFMMLALVAYIRVQVEHWGHFGDQRQLTPSRTVTRSLLGTLFLSPYNINFHVEHHLFPQVPWTNLPRLRDLLCRHPEFQAASVAYRDHLTGVLQSFGMSNRTPHAGQ